MTTGIHQLLAQYERGEISRREYLARVMALVVAAPVAGAASPTISSIKTLNRPFTIKVKQLLLPDSDILEYFCAEDEKDRVHSTSQGN